MFNVKTFNNIAQIGLDQFGTDYSVSPEADNADALLLRSHKLQPEEITANVKAIGRAGAVLIMCLLIIVASKVLSFLTHRVLTPMQ